MYSKEEIIKKYDCFARWYDFSEGLLEFFVGGLRRELLRNCHGKVLEVGVGTGRNFEYYPRACEITAVDFSEGMLSLAGKRARKLGRKISLAKMDAENLLFPDRSFDFVVDTFCLCTYVNPTKALEEMSRVCKPNGKILLLEHGESNNLHLLNYQNRKTESHARRLGCYWNRNPSQLIREAGLTVIEEKRKFLGVFYFIQAKP